MPNDYETLARTLLGGKAGGLNIPEGLLNSEEGRKIAKSLSASASADIKKAAQAAIQGKEAEARDALARVLSTPEGAELFKMLVKMKKHNG